MASNNPFALLVEDDEPVQNVKPTPKPQQKVEQKPVVGLSKPQKPLREQNGSKPRSARKDRPAPKEGSFMEKPEHKDEKKPKNHRHQKPNHGREFDRKSQGVAYKGGEKKEVAGKATWGEEVEGQVEGEKEAKKVVADVKIRQANEGVEDPKWKKLTKIENTEEVFIEVKKDQAPKERKAKEAKQKVTVPIEINFAPPPREPRENRSAGRGRGNGNRGGNRGGKPRGRGGKPAGRSGPGVNVQDTEAFPSLGGN
ncbi:hypothetical protein HK103_001443 [Boothiomyces macroporosus]|uniref:Hyaluronan/mRNA-binding protein domain-containing protein n=1 Tax=Boothiomyces macroporosus TaxID=261099 RepID=A0AAD5UAS2_9FUNG|nr:hypothetical protein HK103_001443 [Boothiomyces macroporosus]